MRKAVIIILAVCMVFVIFVSTFYFIGNSASNAETQATASLSVETASKITVWNKNRDQKIFETEDTAVLTAVSSLISQAAWTSVSEIPASEGTEYILSVYNQSGQAKEYTMIMKGNNDIALVKQKTDGTGAYEKAEFPAQSEGLSTYINIVSANP